jgi:hypothetical protein
MVQKADTSKEYLDFVAILTSSVISSKVYTMINQIQETIYELF